MPIPKGKKRYYLTLDQESMDRAQELVAALNLPRQTVSLVFDEYLRSSLVPRLENILEKKQAGKQLSFGDLFLSIGSSGETSLVTDGENRGSIVEFWLGKGDDDEAVIEVKPFGEQEENTGKAKLKNVPND